MYFQWIVRIIQNTASSLKPGIFLFPHKCQVNWSKHAEFSAWWPGHNALLQLMHCFANGLVLLVLLEVQRTITNMGVCHGSGRTRVVLLWDAEVWMERCLSSLQCNGAGWCSTCGAQSTKNRIWMIFPQTLMQLHKTIHRPVSWAISYSSFCTPHLLLLLFFFNFVSFNRWITIASWFFFYPAWEFGFTYFSLMLLDMSFKGLLGLFFSYDLTKLIYRLSGSWQKSYFGLASAIS